MARTLRETLSRTRPDRSPATAASPRRVDGHDPVSMAQALAAPRSSQPLRALHRSSCTPMYPTRRSGRLLPRPYYRDDRADFGTVRRHPGRTPPGSPICPSPTAHGLWKPPLHESTGTRRGATGGQTARGARVRPGRRREPAGAVVQTGLSSVTGPSISWQVCTASQASSARPSGARRTPHSVAS